MLLLGQHRTELLLRSRLPLPYFALHRRPCLWPSANFVWSGGATSASPPQKAAGRLLRETGLERLACAGS